jgi:hypothetical protein
MKRAFNLLIPVCLMICIAALNNCKEETRNLPVLITVPASSITQTSALLGGQIAYDGGAEIMDRGVCWGMEPNPDISGSKESNNKGTGSFTCLLTRLNPNTLYYARAYATNSEGTAYGGEVHFTTSPPEAPTVVTIVKSEDIYYYGADVGVNIKYDGGAPVTEKGICWSTIENPTIINDEKDISDEDVPDIFECYWCYAGPLKSKSVYYVRAYAINRVDTAYGENVSIQTLAVPEVTTYTATEITTNSATVGGNVTSIGDAYNIETGICYGRDKNPTIDGPHIQAGTIDIGEFTCNLINLTPGVLYYARAYVAWQKDEFFEYHYTVYGNEVTFTTKDLESGRCFPSYGVKIE